MKLMLMIFGLGGLVGLLLLMVIGAQPKSARRFGAPIFLPLALASVLIGIFWIWMYGAMRGFFWDPFNKGTKDVSELSGPDRWLVTALDYVSDPMTALKA